MGGPRSNYTRVISRIREKPLFAHPLGGPIDIGTGDRTPLRGPYFPRQLETVQSLGQMHLTLELITDSGPTNQPGSCHIAFVVAGPRRLAY